MHAVKFDELLKVRRTLTELRTALFKFVKMREIPRTRTFGRTSNRTTLVLPIIQFLVLKAECYPPLLCAGQRHA